MAKAPGGIIDGAVRVGEGASEPVLLPAHMPLAERLPCSRFFGLTANQNWVIEQERAVTVRLYSNGGVDLRTALQDIRQARALGMIHTGNRTEVREAAKRLGVEPSPRERPVAICEAIRAAAAQD